MHTRRFLLPDLTLDTSSRGSSTVALSICEVFSADNYNLN